MKRIFIILLSVNALQANPVLDLLEGKTDGRNLYPFFQEDPEKTKKEEALKQELEENKFVPSPFKQRKAPEVFLHSDRSHPVFQDVAVEGFTRFGSNIGKIGNTDINDIEFQSSYLGLVAHGLATDFEVRAAFDRNGYQGLERLKATIDLTDTINYLDHPVQEKLGILSTIVVEPVLEVIQRALTFSLFHKNEVVLNKPPSKDSTLNRVESAKLSIGKFRPRFGFQGNVDPTLRWTPEPSELTKQIAPANMLGVQYEVLNDNWGTQLGWFSNSLDENIPNFNSSGIIHVGLNYNFGNVGIEANGSRLYDEFQEFRLDYYYNPDGRDSETVSGGHDHIVTLGFATNAEFKGFSRITDKNQSIGVSADLMLANGGESSLWGANISANWFLVKNFLQLVGRYEGVFSQEANGVRSGFGLTDALAETTSFATSFDRGQVLTGNELHSFYLGVNFFVFQEKLRLGLGYEKRILYNDSVVGGRFESGFWQGNGTFHF